MMGSSKLFVYRSNGIASSVLDRHCISFIRDYKVKFVMFSKDNEIKRWCQIHDFETIKSTSDFALIDNSDACVIFWDGIDKYGKQLYLAAKKQNKPYVVFICQQNGTILNVC